MDGTLLMKALVRVPALVIAELRLSLMDGSALCEILRRDRTTANVPIVIAATETRPNELVRAQQFVDLRTDSIVGAEMPMYLKAAAVHCERTGRTLV